MPDFCQKRASELSAVEKKQIATLIKRYYPKATPQYIEDRIGHECNFDILLLKDNDKLLGVSYYNIDKIQTPFSSSPVPIIQFGQALKKEDYRGNLIWRLGHKYAQKNISYLYPLKKVVGISTINSPKVFENFIKLFPNYYPKEDSIEQTQVLGFLKKYFREYRKIVADISSSFTFEYPNITELQDITNDWEKFYKSDNESINELFINAGIIIFEKGRIYKSPKHILACGYRNPIESAIVSLKEIFPFTNKEHAPVNG